ATLVGGPGPSPSPSPTTDFTTSATTVPSSVAPGGSMAITANVTSAAAGQYVVDVEVHDAAEHNVYQQYFEDQAFTAGQTRTFPVAWSVPAGTALGTYTVQIGVFSAGWETDYTWNSYAA